MFTVLIGSKVALQLQIEGKALSCGNKVYQRALLPVIRPWYTIIPIHYYKLNEFIFLYVLYFALWK